MIRKRDIFIPNRGQIRAKVLTLFPRTLHQSLGPMIRASDPCSGPGTPHLGQGPSVWARDPLFGPRTFHLAQGPSTWARSPQSGSRDPWLGPATIRARRWKHMSSATSELLLSHYHIQPITNLEALGTTNHLTLLRLFFLHCFPRREKKNRKIFCECKLDNDQILSTKSRFTPKIDIFRFHSDNITVRDTFAYEHTLIACAIVNGSLTIIKTRTEGVHQMWLLHDVIWWLFTVENNHIWRSKITQDQGTDRYDII